MTRWGLSLGGTSCTLSDGYFPHRQTGQEIPKDRETYIFERFYWANPSRTFDVVGSGLGLSICREIALADGGHIWLERNEPAVDGLCPNSARSAKQLNGLRRGPFCYENVTFLAAQIRSLRFTIHNPYE